MYVCLHAYMYRCMYVHMYGQETGEGIPCHIQDEQNHLLGHFWDSFQKDMHVLPDLLYLSNHLNQNILAKKMGTESFASSLFSTIIFYKIILKNPRGPNVV